MIIKTFKSGHPIGSSLDPSGPSGLTHRNRGSEYYYYPPESKYIERNYWAEENNSNSSTGLIHSPYHYSKQDDSTVCHIIRYPYNLELIFVWVCLPLLLGLIHLWRSSKRRSSETNEKNQNICSTSWIFLVLHSNLTCYFWITYYVLDNVYNCTNEGNYPFIQSKSVMIAVIGAISLGIAFLISAIAAIRNDMYYPDAQMTPREATHFINHLKGTNPEMNIILKSHVRLTDHGHLLYDANTGRRVDISYIGYAGNPGVDDWKRPKKSFEPCNWKDVTTKYPDVKELIAGRHWPNIRNRAQSTSSYRTQSLMLKISLSINPQSENASKDLNKCVLELARESGQRDHQTWISHDDDDMEDIIEEKYKLHAAIPSLNNSQNQETNRRNERRQLPVAVRFQRLEARGTPSQGFPMVTIEKPIYIYIVPTTVDQGVSSESSIGLPFFIRFAWILNLLGCSGIVLFFLYIMHYPTETLKIVKKYGCRRNDNPTTTHDVGASSNSNPRTGLVVNLGNTATNREGNISPRHVGRPHIQSNVNNLPMPPPYTSREPSISQHPMSPPPRYTSVQGINNIGNSPHGLQVNIPEEEPQNINETEENPQPPSYQEAISSQDDKLVEDKN